jgi:exodeoxyribonuclease III
VALTIATWNINSVRLRIDLVKRLVAESQPDVICLQETKTPDEFFPREAFEALGYRDMLVHGMKGYNGVAVLSRVKLGTSGTRGWCAKQDCRHGVVELPGGIEIHNIYIPAGGDIPDPELNDKFAHKLQFLDELTEWFGEERQQDRKMILVGDLNVAPLETDVWSHKALLKVVSHTPVEVEALTRLQQAHAWIDIGRRFIPAPERCFTWWSYRSPDWTRNDRGRRLDHMWASPELAERLAAHQVLEPCRHWERPSDHVPLICEIEI